jgi:site-specific recombinase XerD
MFCATHLQHTCWKMAQNIRIVRFLPGHKDVKTTEIYTHVMSTQFNDVKSPLDML